MLPTAPSPLVSVTVGDLPCLLTCGHDGAEAPPGVSERTDPSAVTVRDVRTRNITNGLAAALAKTFAPQRPSVVLANFARKYIDVNRSRWFAYEAPRAVARPYYDAYHRAIRCVSHKIETGLLLDIHGTAIGQSDLFLGTVYHNSVANLWVVHTLAASLASAGYDVFLNHPRLSGGFTVLAHGDWTGGLDAVQLEIARPFRLGDTREEKLIHDLSEAVAVVVKGYDQLRFIV